MRWRVWCAGSMIALGLLGACASRAPAQGLPSVLPSVNNPHPAFPWFYPTALVTNAPRVVRLFDVPPRVVTVAPSPTTAGWEIVVPGYRIAETGIGYVVVGHWDLRQIGGVHYWVWIPAYFVGK